VDTEAQEIMVTAVRKRSKESRAEKRARVRLERATNGWSEAALRKDRKDHVVHKPGAMSHH
jgi:hypothetical protein